MDLFIEFIEESFAAPVTDTATDIPSVDVEVDDFLSDILEAASA